MNYIKAENVKIGKNVKIGRGTIICDNVEIKDNVVIHPYAIIGDNPQHVKAEKNPNGKIIIGKNTIIREFVTIHAPIEDLTQIGKNCYLMATSHIAHDCILNDNIVLCNSVNLSGHTLIDNNAIFGLNSTTHQFTTIGAFSMIGMNTPITSDVLPFTVCYGNPSRWYRLNRIGLDRHTTKEVLKEAEKVLSWGKQNHNYIYALKNDLMKQTIISLGMKSKQKEISKPFLWFEENRNRSNRKTIKYGGLLGHNLDYKV